jgi:hypothetical protein
MSSNKPEKPPKTKELTGKQIRKGFMWVVLIEIVFVTLMTLYGPQEESWLDQLDNPSANDENETKLSVDQILIYK